MKKLSRSLSLLVLAFALVLPTLVVFGASANNADGFSSSVDTGSGITECSQKASEETLALARIAVQKATDSVVFSYYLNSTLEQKYETAKIVAPEVSILETKADASIALIELYEEFLVDFREYDIDSDKVFWKNSRHQKNIVLTDSLRYGQLLFGKIKTVEALLAVDHYYNLLTEQDRLRMMAAFDEVATLNFISSQKFYDDAVFSTYFERFRTMREDELLKQQEYRSVYVDIENIRYPLGSPVSTLDGDSVSTYIAPREFPYEDIVDARRDFAGSFGYADVEYVNDASMFYNCHAYAWHSRNPGRCWIDHNQTVGGTTYYGVERYFSDDHCTYLGNTESVAQEGDIIVYWVNGKPAHSGIVVETNPIRIQSKWGWGCVVEHNVSSVPDQYRDSGYTLNVGYYRYSHDYEYVSINDTKHEQECTVCSHTKNQENHTPTYVSKNNTQHTIKCNLCGHELSTESHNPVYTEAGSVRHRVSCTECNYSRLEVHILVNNKCQRCDYVNDNLNSIGDETIDVMQE